MNQKTEKGQHSHVCLFWNIMGLASFLRGVALQRYRPRSFTAINGQRAVDIVRDGSDLHQFEKRVGTWFSIVVHHPDPVGATFHRYTQPFRETARSPSVLL